MSIPTECAELSLIFAPAGSGEWSGSAASLRGCSLRGCASPPWLHTARVIVLGAAKVKLELGLSLTPASCAVCGRGAQGDHVLG